MAKRLLAAVVVVVVVVALALLATRGCSTSAPDPASDVAPSAVTVPPPAPAPAADAEKPQAAPVVEAPARPPDRAGRAASPEIPPDEPEAAPVAQDDGHRPITGIVRALGGGPIRGALVSLESDARGREPHVVAEARTDAGGRFSLRTAGWGEGAVVSASAHGHARMIRNKVARGGFVEFDLPVAGVLCGRVFDEATGRGVARATVLVGSENLGARSGSSTVADAEGLYEVADALPGTAWVYGRAPGYRSDGVSVVVPPGAVTVVDLPLSRGATVRGRVMRDGAPAVGATVRLLGFQHDEVPVVTAADGTFAITGFANECGAKLRVSAEGPVQRDVALEPTQEREVRVDVDLTGCWTIRGRVTLDGAPCATAFVALNSSADVSVPTGEDGGFEISADACDPCELWVRGEGAWALANVARPQRGAVAEGVVVGLTSVPLVGARLVDDSGNPLANGHAWTDGSGSLASDADGRLVLALPPASPDEEARDRTVSFFRAGHVLVQRKVRAAPGTQDLGTIVLARAAASFVAGRVVDPAGRPVAAAGVSAEWEGGCVQGLTGADGAFRLEGVPERPLTVRALFAGRAAASREQVAAGSRDVELVLGDSTAPLVSAIVTRASGEPAYRFWVTTFRIPGAGGEPDARAVGAQSQVLSARGLFSSEEARDVEFEFVCGDEVGRLSVTPAAPGTPATSDGPAGGHRVRLAPGGTVRGTVRVAGGAPAAGARVKVRREGETLDDAIRHRDAQTDRDGLFVVGPLVPGPYVLTIETNDWPRRVVPIDVRAAATTHLEQTLAAGGLRIRVFDESGTPVLRARCRLLDLQGRPVAPFAVKKAQHAQSTESPGVLTFARLDPGRYRVRVEVSEPALLGELDVEVRADEVTDWDVRVSERP